jgi:hypothetical protein
MEAHYFSIARQFFLLLVLLQVWTLGADVVLKSGLTKGATVNVLVMLVALVLAYSNAAKLHRLASAAVWGLFLAVVVLRGVGVVD